MLTGTSQSRRRMGMKRKAVGSIESGARVVWGTREEREGNANQRSRQSEVQRM